MWGAQKAEEIASGHPEAGCWNFATHVVGEAKGGTSKRIEK
jgi:hypothetical protein